MEGGGDPIDVAAMPNLKFPDNRPVFSTHLAQSPVGQLKPFSRWITRVSFNKNALRR